MNKNLKILHNYLLEKGLEKDELETFFNNIEKELTDKRYGIIWEEQKENILDKLRLNFPLLKDFKDKEIINDITEPTHVLIEGDNLESLYLLNYTHKGLIDAIIIDPPYNTGKDGFVYNDKIVDKEDIWKHSKWLSFMEKRLRLAYELLTNEGLIFINIDDNEQAQLKLLCDEIFNENNFISCIPRRTKSGGKTTNKITLNHDYILIYCKNINDVLIDKFEHTDKGYKFKDKYFEKRGYYKLNQTLDYDSLQYSSGLDYPLTIEGETYYPGSNYEMHLERKKGNHRRADWAWRWSPKLFEFGYENDFVVVKRNKKGGARIYTKTYQNVKLEENSNGYYIDTIERKIPLSTLEFMESMYSNDNAKKDLNKILSNFEFDYPKPVALIKKIIQLIPNKNAIILDFFAGSGTTGQAVLELNKEDGGNRQFILCTNNEVKKDTEIDFMIKHKKVETPPAKRSRNAYKEWQNKYIEFTNSKSFKNIISGDKFQELGICRSITYTRLSKLITGYKKDKKSYKELGGNLKYYIVEFSKDKEDIHDNAQSLINKCSEIISLKENCYNIIDTNEEYDIVTDGQKIVLIYKRLFTMDYHLDNVAEILNEYKLEKIIYTTNTSYYLEGITIKEYPEEIIELYNKLRKSI